MVKRVLFLAPLVLMCASTLLSVVLIIIVSANYKTNLPVYEPYIVCSIIVTGISYIVGEFIYDKP